MTTAKKAVKIVDFNHEYHAIESLAISLWAGLDNDNAKAAMRFMFNQGLRDAKFWVDQYITHSILGLVSNHDPFCNLMEFRINAAANDHRYSNSDSSAMMHDTLFIFDRALSDGLNMLMKSYCERNWDFTAQAEKHMSTIKKQFAEINISPKFMSDTDENELLRRYDGIEAVFVGAPSTRDQLTRNFVIYSRDEQGRTLFYSIFSVIYSHALYCAKLKNSNDMIEAMLPIYRQYQSPINMDNGEELLTLALKNPLFAIINKINPVKFLSSDIYLEKEEKRKKYMAETTEEERAANRKKMRESIAERALNAHRSPAQVEEARQAEEKFFNHINNIINTQGCNMPDVNV